METVLYNVRNGISDNGDREVKIRLIDKLLLAISASNNDEIKNIWEQRDKTWFNSTDESTNEADNRILGNGQKVIGSVSKEWKNWQKLELELKSYNLI